MTLYLVGTPIGNLEDITLRALQVLRTVGLVAAEDTRHTGKLLKHFEISTPLISFHDHSGQARLAQVLEALAAQDVALVTDAGMPGLSDPGYELVRAAIDAGISVVPIPGPAAAITALVASGLPTDRFLFLGFLPRQQKARRTALAEVAHLPYTLVLYEAPHRLLALLEDALTVLGDRPACVARELTKLHETFWRGPLSQGIAHFSQDKIRGEITVIIGGAPQESAVWTEAEVRRALADRLAAGLSRKEAAAAVAEQSGWRKRQLYRLTLADDDTD